MQFYHKCRFLDFLKKQTPRNVKIQGAICYLNQYLDSYYLCTNGI
jgi:hypothetical protein